MKIRKIPLNDLINYLLDIHTSGVRFIDLEGERLPHADKLIISDSRMDEDRPLTMEYLEKLWL